MRLTRYRGYSWVLPACFSLLLLACSEQSSPGPSTEKAPAITSAAQPTTADGSATLSPPEQTTATKVPTTSGAYLVTLRPQENEFLIGQPQPWIASITDAHGQPFTPGTLYFDGGMPGHGHGLPSAPRFTRHLGGANFLLEGMTLNMPGDWRFVVTVGGAAGTDSAVFDFNIQPGPADSAFRKEHQKIADALSNNDRTWTSEQRGLIESLRLDKQLPAQDHSNRFMADKQAIALGKLLFNESGLSASNSVSCASCHLEQHGFADTKAFSVGSKETARHTPALLGVAQASWFYWDGRRDSLWAQALTPVETVGEMDSNRTDTVRFIAAHPLYSKAYAALAPEESQVFSELADTERFPVGASPFGSGRRSWYRMSQADQFMINSAYATFGKIIASYEATLVHQSSKFDQFAQQLAAEPNMHSKMQNKNSAQPQSALSPDEQAGLKLFLDLPKTQCLRCHNGSQFTNHGFHNVASAEREASAESKTSENIGRSEKRASHDFGRMLGLQAVIVDPFNCSGEFSDAGEEGCNHLTFARRQNLADTIDGAFKVPGLRNLKNTAPYFHDGRFESLAEVIDHYRNQGVDNIDNKNSAPRVSEVPDIQLTDKERDQLVAFLSVL